MKNKLFIIDATGLIFRAYYSMIRSPLRNSKGQNTSAIYGFFRMLNVLIRDYKPYNTVMAFDVSRETFRREIYPEYKAHREAAPDELKEQIGPIIDMVKAMNIPSFAMEGFEADDVIGTLCEKLKNRYDLRVVTGDKDLFQLVDDQVKIIGLIKGLSEIRELGREGVKEVKGVYPEQIPDYLAIAGDSSDNIPGVRGIGEKGAVKLLSEYSTLENIYDNIDKIKGAVQKKLIESKDNAFLSKKLAIIRKDLEIDVNIFPSLVESINIGEELRKIFQEYELNKLLSEIEKQFGITGQGNIKADEKQKRGKYFSVTDRGDFDALIVRIRSLKKMSLDFETTSVNTLEAEIIGIAVALKEGEAFYIPVGHGQKSEISEEEIFSKFAPIFEDHTIKKLGQNLKYECKILLNRGIRLQGIETDSMIAAYLLDSSRTHYDLDTLAEEWIDGYKTIHYDELIDPKTQTLLDADLERVTEYAGEDADIALRLCNRFTPLLEKQGLMPVWKEIDGPLVPVLAEMEYNGILIDTDRLADISKELKSNMEKLKSQIVESAGEDFNLNSTQQLGVILYEKLGLPVLKKTGKTKRPSTDEATLSQLASMHPLPALLLEYRKNIKLKNTYVDVLPTLIQPNTGRVHTSFQQTVTATGRLSSNNPNLQNIPVRDTIGKRIRSAFIAGKGNILISADYSQIELRIFAHLSEDKSMIRAFRDNIDIHANTAALMFGIPVEEVSEEQRRAAKVINYGISYGMGPYRLSHELGISMSEAKNFIEDYFEKFPGLRDFMRRVLEEASSYGKVLTIYGRKRPVPELLGKPVKNLRNLSHPQRFSINHVVQGTAADIIKIAMARVYTDIVENQRPVKMLLQIHDEILLECPEDIADETAGRLREIMEHAADLRVPLSVDVGIGKNWGEAH